MYLTALIACPVRGVPDGSILRRATKLDESPRSTYPTVTREASVRGNCLSALVARSGNSPAHSRSHEAGEV